MALCLGDCGFESTTELVLEVKETGQISLCAVVCINDNNSLSC